MSKDKSDILTSYCYNLKTIPQFSGTCWLNAIITSMLYSQGLRNILIKILNKRKKTKDKLFNFILYMLKNNNEYDVQDLRLDFLLLSHIEIYNKFLGSYFKERVIKEDFAYNIFYICILFFYYKIPYLDLYYHNNQLYYDRIRKPSVLDTKFENTIEKTDILIICKNIDTCEFNEKNKLDKFRDKIDNYDKLLNDIKEVSNIISINNNNYILDSCLIGNYDNLDHAIAGITCNNNKYVLDSVNNENVFKRINEKKLKYKLNPCQIFIHNWHINREFCINTKECIIYNKPKNDRQEKNVCYNINKSKVYLIYIKEKSSDKLLNTITNDEYISYRDFNFSKKSISKKINNMYSNLKDLNNSALFDYLYEIGYTNDVYFYLLSNVRNNFKYLYQKLLKKKILLYESDEEILKNLCIALILKYLKKGIIYDLNNLTDAKTINLFIELNTRDKKPIENDDYDSLIMKLIEDNFDEVYKYFFITNSDFYDSLIINKIKKDKKRQLLFKLFVESKLFKKNYRKKINNINHKRIFNKSKTPISSISSEKEKIMEEETLYRFLEEEPLPKKIKKN